MIDAGSLRPLYLIFQHMLAVSRLAAGHPQLGGTPMRTAAHAQRRERPPAPRHGV
jgi:hypothetical protein